MNRNLTQEYLRALGIQGWQLKTALGDDVPYSGPQRPSEIEANKHVQVQTFSVPEFNNIQPAIQDEIVALASDDSLVAAKISTEVKSVFQAEPETQGTHNLADEAKETESSIDPDSVVDTSNLDSTLVQSIRSCQQCTARTARRNALVGQGNSNASVFIICDAPNAEEDIAGHYLTGQSQSLFQAMWKSIGSENDYYLTGIIKCHSMENYLVNESELHNCANFLYSQLEQVKPDCIVVFGAMQAQAMLKTSQSFNELRGQIHKVTLNQTEYSLVVTYHPAYLLRNPLFKKPALADLLSIKSVQR